MSARGRDDRGVLRGAPLRRLDRSPTEWVAARSVRLAAARGLVRLDDAEPGALNVPGRSRSHRLPSRADPRRVAADHRDARQGDGRARPPRVPSLLARDRPVLGAHPAPLARGRDGVGEALGGASGRSRGQRRLRQLDLEHDRPGQQVDAGIQELLVRERNRVERLLRELELRLRRLRQRSIVSSRKSPLPGSPPRGEQRCLADRVRERAADVVERRARPRWSTASTYGCTMTVLPAACSAATCSCARASPAS